MGLEAHVKRSHCPANITDYEIESIMKWAQDAGKRTGEPKIQ